LFSGSSLVVGFFTGISTGFSVTVASITALISVEMILFYQK
jgi:hypothetical protein